MAKKVSKPNDVLSPENMIFSWDKFIHDVTNGHYVLVLGSEIMLSKSNPDLAVANGDSNMLIYNDVRDYLIEQNILAPNNADVNFSELSYHIQNVDRYIKYSINDRLEFNSDELDPELVKLLRTKLFRVVLTTTYDPYALKLMECAWGKGKVRVMNVNSIGRDDNFDFDRYVLDDTLNPLPPTLYYIFGKAFPADGDNRFVATDNDAIETVSKWMSKDAPQKFLSYIRSKRILALGCKFDDWFFRFFWYSLHGTVKGFRKGEVAISLNSNSETDCKLKRYFEFERIYFQPDARLFIKQMLGRINEYNIVNELLSRRKNNGVFLSYAHEDFEIASRIFFYLQEQGFDVWFDERNLKCGDNYDNDIADAIYKSKVFIPLLSAQCQRDIENESVRYYKDVEWSVAQAAHNLNSRFNILPIRVPGFNISSPACVTKLPECMAKTYFDVEKSSLNELVNRLRELLNK